MKTTNRYNSRIHRYKSEIEHTHTHTHTEKKNDNNNKKQNREEILSYINMHTRELRKLKNDSYLKRSWINLIEQQKAIN